MKMNYPVGFCGLCGEKLGECKCISEFDLEVTPTMYGNHPKSMSDLIAEAEAAAGTKDKWGSTLPVEPSADDLVRSRIRSPSRILSPGSNCYFCGTSKKKLAEVCSSKVLTCPECALEHLGASA